MVMDSCHAIKASKHVRGYLPSSIIYRNYIVSKQGFETIYESNISSPRGSSLVTKPEPQRLEFSLLTWRFLPLGIRVSKT